jgi:excisionase family DNA binding protein
MYGASSQWTHVSAANNPTSIIESLAHADHALSVTELAQVLDVSRLTLYRWVGEGKIPHLRLGSIVRFCGPTTAAWLRARESVPAWFTRREPSVN